MSTSTPSSLASALVAAGVLFQIPDELLVGLPAHAGESRKPAHGRAPLATSIGPSLARHHADSTTTPASFSHNLLRPELPTQLLHPDRGSAPESATPRHAAPASEVAALETPLNELPRESRSPKLETGAWGEQPGGPLPPRRRDAWTPFLARIGRPAIFTPELVTEISDNITRYGMTDTCAARNAGVSSSTISRWKQEVPNFREFLDEARDAFESEHLRRIEAFRRKDGQCDPASSRWFLQKCLPEKYGRGSGRRNSGCGARAASGPSAGRSAAGNGSEREASANASQLEALDVPFWEQPFTESPSDAPTTGCSLPKTLPTDGAPSLAAEVVAGVCAAKTADEGSSSLPGVDSQSTAPSPTNTKPAPPAPVRCIAPIAPPKPVFAATNQVVSLSNPLQEWERRAA